MIALDYGFTVGGFSAISNDNEKILLLHSYNTHQERLIDYVRVKYVNNLRKFF